MNRVEKAFRHIIAWDNNKIVPNPQPHLTKLGANPRYVSADLINPLRDLIEPSPRKLRFSKVTEAFATSDDDSNNSSVVKTPYRSALQELMNQSPKNDERTTSPCCRERFEESVDQLEMNLDAETGELSPERELANEIQPAHQAGFTSTQSRFEESVDQFADEYDLEMKNAGRSGLDEHSSGSGVESNDLHENEGSTPLCRGIPTACIAQSDSQGLSPAERIMRRINMRKRNRGEFRDESISEQTSSPSARPSTRLRRGAQCNNHKEAVTVTVDEELEAANQRVNNRDSRAESGIPAAKGNSREISTRRGRGANDHGPVVTGSSGSSTQERQRTMGYSSVFLADGIESIPPTGAFAGVVDSQICPQQQGVAVFVPPVEQKRAYRFNNRTKSAPKTQSAFRLKCLTLVKQSYLENPFETARDCCGSECFSNVNPDYAVIQYRKILSMDRADKKRALRSMYDRGEKQFWFDGLRICSRFLSRGFTFSNQLQSAVKGTLGARASASILACPRDSSKEYKRRLVCTYLRDLAQRIDDCLPTRSHINLPLLTKAQVYKRFCKMHVPDFVSRSYFYDVWSKHCLDIKTHRHHGFTVCETCERIRSGLAIHESEEMQRLLRKQMEQHYTLIDEERRVYEARRNLSKANPDKYCSIIVDGADQKSYGLPHFVSNTKEEKGHKLKVRCIGVLEHGTQKELSLFTLTEEFESGANHVIEAVHRVLDKKMQKFGKLPEVLFVQADNFTRENKNHFFMAYFEMLVKTGVFTEVQISFLPIGHTHADIDQPFSSVANRLRLVDAITLEELLAELRNCYTPWAKAEDMEKVANFSGLCKASRCLWKVKGFSKFRYFRFSRKKMDNSSVQRGVDGSCNSFPTCHVKIQSRDDLEPLDNTERITGFLKSCPDLQDTPVTDTTPPDNVLKVNAHIRSVESRMRTAQNLSRLEAIRDRVYTRRIDHFHWDLETIFELKGGYIGSSDENCNVVSAVEESSEQIRLEQLNYPLNFFLAVKTEDNCTDPFWIVRTLWVAETDEDGKVLKLKVRWYQAKVGSRDAFSALYEMASYVSRGQRTFHDDVVDVRSVMCEFEALTSQGGLHIRTQKSILQTLEMS